MTNSEVHGLVDHLFRHQAGRMVATLVRIFGHENLDLAEEVVQDALLRALQLWPFHGVPDNPRAWLVQAAKNRALDVLRRRTLEGRKEAEVAHHLAVGAAVGAARVELAFAREVEDDTLRLVFLCCHPVLPHEARVALTLGTVAGFGVGEIARALLLEPATAAQRVVRAKRKLREAGVSLEMPTGDELLERLEAVLEVVYLLFNEGYGAHAGEDLVHADLCGEAIRLGMLLARHPVTDRPEVHALLALMLLQAARLPARVDGSGDLLLLSEQDRARWDRPMIHHGLRELERAAEGEELGEYHLQAGIAACHALAPDYGSTDWPRILALYDTLVSLQPSPVVRLNRAVAVAMVRGPEAGLEAVQGLEDEPALRRYPLLPATLADLHRRGGDPARAAAYLRRALELPCTDAERRFLTRRLEEVGQRAYS